MITNSFYFLFLKRSISYLSATCLFTLFTTQILFSQSDFLNRSEKKAQQILEKTIMSLGGSSYITAENIVKEGKIFGFRQENLKAANKFRMFEKYPLKRRVELGDKGEIVFINDATKGWKIKYKDVKEQSKEEIKFFLISMKHTLDHILRFRRKEKGMKIRYLGKTRSHLLILEGVQLMDQEGDKIKIYVNAHDFLPVKMEFKSPPFGKRWATEDKLFFHNYHEINGIKIPFTTILNSNGFKATETQLSSVKVSSSLSDSLFLPPKE